jgi:hypothetical protein
MIEEEVFKDKELRNPAEARKTITKIMVIISIAVSIEGLVYIFKAGKLPGNPNYPTKADPRFW